MKKDLKQTSPYLVNNSPHGQENGDVFVYLVACWQGMAAGRPLWCCCSCTFGCRYTSMARSGVGNHGLVSLGVPSE